MFFSIEPLYLIIEQCIKELILYYYYQNMIVEDLYNKTKGRFKGDFFEMILVSEVSKAKKFWIFKFDDIISINSIVPYYFSIKTYSYRLLKNNNIIELEKYKQNNDDKKDIEEESEEEINIISTNSFSNISSINYNKKYYSKKKDKLIFKELKEIIDKTFGIKIETKILDKKSYFLKQIKTNGKYVDAGLLIYKGEGKNNKFYFILKVFQITIKKEKIKIYDANETSLILTYIKEYLEKIFTNLEIIEASLYYILDSKNSDKNIVDLCNKYLIGCLNFNTEKKVFNNMNKFNFNVNN